MLMHKKEVALITTPKSLAHARRVGEILVARQFTPKVIATPPGDAEAMMMAGHIVGVIFVAGTTISHPETATCLATEKGLRELVERFSAEGYDQLLVLTPQSVPVVLTFVVRVSGRDGTETATLQSTEPLLELGLDRLDKK